MAAGGCYLYAIVETPRVWPVRPGIDGAPARLVGGSGPGAVVSDVAISRVQAELREGEAAEGGWLARAARAHDAVVAAAHRTGPTVPLRFGTAFRGEAELRGWLAEHAAVLAAELARLRDSGEWAVRVWPAGPGGPGGRRQVAGDGAAIGERPQSGGGPPSGGRAYLAAAGERRRRAAATLEGARWLHDQLRSAADGSRTRPGAGELLLSARYLVREPARRSFTRALATAAGAVEAAGIRVECSGPWPPYSFTDLHLATGDG